MNFLFYVLLMALSLAENMVEEMNVGMSEASVSADVDVGASADVAVGASDDVAVGASGSGEVAVAGTCTSDNDAAMMTAIQNDYKSTPMLMMFSSCAAIPLNGVDYICANVPGLSDACCTICPQTVACQHNSLHWDAGWGPCTSYSGYNKHWCNDDYAHGFYASEVCSECNACADLEASVSADVDVGASADVAVGASDDEDGVMQGRYPSEDVAEKVNAVYEKELAQLQEEKEVGASASTVSNRNHVFNLYSGALFGMGAVCFAYYMVKGGKDSKTDFLLMEEEL